MEILIVVALLAGYLAIRGSDKAASRRIDAQHVRDTTCCDEWVSRVYEETWFWEVRQMLSDFISGKETDKEKWEHIYNEVMAAYREMGWSEIKSIFPGTSDADNFLRCCWNDLFVSEIVQPILLADRGLLSEWDARHGISFTADSKLPGGSKSPFVRVTSPGERDWYAKQMRYNKKLGHYIIRKLREHGVNDQAFFEPDNRDFQTQGAFKIYPFGSEPDNIPGKLVFYPAIPEFKRKYIVR